MSGQTVPLGFLFSHTLQLIRVKYDVALKQFKFNILILFLSEILGNQGNKCCFIVSKKFNADILSDAYH